MGRIRSDLQTIAGSFTPPSEGVVFFLWDNTYVHFLFFLYFCFFGFSFYCFFFYVFIFVFNYVFVLYFFDVAY